MEEEKKPSVFLDASAHFLAGWVSGCAGVLVSHPFDTVKVRLQTQGVVPNVTQHYTGTWHCLVDTIKQESLYGLFKGMSSPLLGTALWNAVVFGTYGNTVRLLSGGDLEKQHHMKTVFLGSLAAGIAQTFVICPLELTKTRLQIQSSVESTVYKGLIDCVKKIYQQDGWKGIFNGYQGTVYRDIIGFPVYFCAFEALCRLMSEEKPPYKDLGPMALILGGGLAGALSWACAFPPDVIKCRIQVDYSGKYSGFSDCLKKSYKEEGMKLFRRGFAPCVIRGFPMNAAIFSIYHLSIRFYEEQWTGTDLSKYS